MNKISFRLFKIKDFENFSNLFNDKSVTGKMKGISLSSSFIQKLSYFITLRKNSYAIILNDLFIGFFNFRKVKELDGYFLSAFVLKEYRGLGYFPIALKEFLKLNKEKTFWAYCLSDSSLKCLLKNDFVSAENILVRRSI